MTTHHRPTRDCASRLGPLACCALVATLGCGAESDKPPPEAGDTPNPASELALLPQMQPEGTWHAPPSQNLAAFADDPSYQRATNKLALSKTTPDLGWGETARIVARYPIHLPGVDRPSYYEYKVADGQRDAGYILVNTDQTDLAIPELATEGPTLAERYRDALGSADYKVYRYGPATSSAKATEADGSERWLAVGGVLAGEAVVGLPSPQVTEQRLQQLQEKDTQYRNLVATSGCVPTLTREALDRYYEQLGPPYPADPGSSLGYAQQEVDRVGPYYLSHTFSSIGWHLPHWWQPRSSNNYPVGCGPVAWAMALAYWSQFKGVPALFDYRDLSGYVDTNQFANTFVADIMWELADDLETVWGGSGDDKWGMTYPSDSTKGTKYAKRVGYLESSASKEDAGAHDKWNKVKAAILDDKPAILLIHDDGIGFANHYVGVEGVQKETSGIDSLGYYINQGSASKNRKWIYDLDGEPDYSVFDAIVIDKIGNTVWNEPWYASALM